MKVFVALSALLAVAAASQIMYLAPGQIILPSASSQYHSQDGLGQYAFGYNDPLSAKQESKTLDGVTRGSYSYIDANGILQQVVYTADAGGFRVEATNLPKAVEVPTIPSQELPRQVEDTFEVAAAKAAHFAAIEEAKRMNGIQQPAPIIQVAAPIELPKPVEDTPEVTKAKAEHLEAVEQAKLRISGMAKIDNGISLTQGAPLVVPYPLAYYSQPLARGFSYSSSSLNAPALVYSFPNQHVLL